LPDSGFGIYVHWPFCQAKCPYCDFNSHVVARVDQAAWRESYRAEIARHAALIPDRVVGSIFFGGGTPSLMEPETVASVIDDIRAQWRVANDIEITLEANPTSVEAARFRAYHAAGVDRVSIGVQALNDADLRRLAADGRFRRDLLDRLAFDVITVPPLRERLEDILPLAYAFAINMASELKRELFAGFGARASSSLLQHDWPGNISEMRQCIVSALDKSTLQPFLVEAQRLMGKSLARNASS